MLGQTISDPENTEGGGTVAGMGLLPMDTIFETQKHRTRVCGKVGTVPGLFADLSGAELEGYEIHMGSSALKEGAIPLITLANGRQDGCCRGNVYGSYLHGFFDSEQ